ncbi:MAG: MBL fold metallo-hydrolase [Treponema sp.]|nr:MBL fold metallo-hydrolase [Treponema sp.]
MKLYFHYCSFQFNNCYILGGDKHKDAIIVDPGSIEEQLLEYIEKNNLNLKAALITHDHIGHVHGLRTLLRIYQVEIFAINRSVLDISTTPVKDGDKIDIGPYTVEIISIPGHSADSAVYRIDNLLFTGDVLTTGLIGTTDSAYGAATQVNKLRSRLLSLPGDYTVLPGHGPPSTLEAERRYNVGISQYSEEKTRKPSIRLSF